MSDMKQHVKNYGIALLAVGASITVRYGLTLYLGHGLPTYTLFYPAVILSALLAGIGPGLFATLASVILAGLWLLPSQGSLLIVRTIDWIGLFIFIINGVMISIITGRYRLIIASKDKIALDQTTARARVEQALGESEHRMWLAIKNAPVSFAMQDRDLRFTYAYNQKTMRPDDIIGKTDKDIFSPADAARLMALKRKVLETGNVVRDSLWLAVGDIKLYLELFIEPILDENGAVTGLGIATVDMTRVKLAEEELQRKNEQLRLAQQSAGAGLWDWDIPSNTLQWSAELYRLFDLDPENTPPTFDLWNEILHPQDRAIAAERIKTAMQDRVRLSSEYRIVNRAGHIRWIHALGDTVYDGDGKPLRMSGICLDITEHKLAEKALRKNENELRLILDTVPAMVFYKDVNNSFIRVNRAFEKVMGMDRRMLEGRSLFDIYPKEQADAFWNDDREVLATGKPKTGIVEPVDTADGTRLVQTDKIPILDESGQAVGIIGFAVDITERMLAENALRESEENYRKLVKYAPAAIYEIDSDGTKFLSVNQVMCDILKYPMDELLAKNPADLLDQEGKALFQEWIRKKLAGETLDESREYRVLRKDGEWIDMSLNLGTLNLRNDDPARIVVIAHDITDRKRAEAALKQNQEDFARAQEVGQIGSWRLDVVHNVLTWSDENYRIFNLSREMPLSYETFLNTVHPEDREYVDRQWKAALAGEPYDIEHRIVAEGTVKWVREKAYLEIDETGALLGGFGITQDITMRKEAENKLRKSLQDLGERNNELQRLNRAMVGRELRMIELKQQVNELCEVAGEPPRYNIDLNGSMDYTRE